MLRLQPQIVKIINKTQGEGPGGGGVGVFPKYSLPGHVSSNYFGLNLLHHWFNSQLFNDDFYLATFMIFWLIFSYYLLFCILANLSLTCSFVLLFNCSVTVAMSNFK